MKVSAPAVIMPMTLARKSRNAAECHLPLSQLQSDPDDRQRWDQGNGDRHAGDGIAGLASNVGVGAGGQLGSQGDAEVDQAG